MAFVILSTGPVTGSRLHTLRIRTLLLGLGALLLAVGSAGLSVGYHFGQTYPSAAIGADAPSLPPLDTFLEHPEGRALIERIGALSGRVIQLETEAAVLAGRIGMRPEDEHDAATPALQEASVDRGPNVLQAEFDVPSGGPLLPAAETFEPALSAERDYDLRLQRIDRKLDAVSRRLDRLAMASTWRELQRMAYPGRLPIASRQITSEFGVRVDPFTRRPARHTGLDFLAPRNTPITAAGGGRVTFAGYRPEYGNTVEIEHGEGLATRYAHASRLLVRRGQVVLPGQQIAIIGSTGRSTGTHLHFEVLRNGRPVEPRDYLFSSGT